MTIGLGEDFWICLCWVGVLCLGSCFLFEFLECDSCVLPGSNFSLHLIVVVTVGSKQNVSGYWELTAGNEDMPGV